MEFSESSKQIWRNSRNPVMKELGGEPVQAGATYSQDQIFVGWNLGGKQLLRELEEEYLSHDRLRYNEAKRMALRSFQKQVGDRRGEVVIDRSSADVLFLGGRRGAGKSFVMRGITNRSAEAGVTNIVVDPENEYYSNMSYNGIQSGLENLRPRESKQRIDTKVLMPYPVYKARRNRDMPNRGTDHTKVFKFEFSDLTANDISFVINSLDDHPDYQMLALELTKRVNSASHDIGGWQDVIDVAWEMDEEGKFNWGGGKRPQQMENYIRTKYMQYRFLGSEDRYSIDLEQILNQYNTVALSLHDGDGLPDELAMREVYVAILFKKVRNLVEQGRVEKPVSWSLDEAHELAPASADPDRHPSKKQVRQAIKKDRKRGFRVSMATQAPGDVQEENFLDQVRHFFIPQNMKKKPRKKLLDVAGVYSVNDASREKWHHIFEAMDQYQWLYVDEQTGFWCVLEVASPLAYHRTE